MTQTDSPCRVLIIDDDPDIRETTALVFQALGHEAETAADGASGVARGRTFGPQLVLLDVGLPDVDGYQVAEQIRAEPWGRAAVLVAMTGWTREQDKQAAMTAGFDMHVAKPVTLEQLRTLVAQAVATSIITQPHE